MHIVNQIEDIHINARQPVQHLIVFMHDFLIIEVFGCDRRIRRTNLHRASVFGSVFLVSASVDGIEKAFGKIGTGAELACLGGGDAAADAVVVPPDRTHDIVVFILDRGCVDGDFGSIFLKCLWQAGRVKDGQVWFWGRSHIFQRM